ncbi:MAG: hypothetical protein ACTTKN_00440 [Phocaeicola sp.]|uniref:hypothetical protein n=1 Tax=Phocaeicola sp. TaxID=2773926 RepID=UPI003FA095FE
MSTKEDYQEFSNKLRYGLEEAERQLIEDTARRDGELCYGSSDGKVIHVPASKVLSERNSGIARPKDEPVDGTWFR